MALLLYNSLTRKKEEFTAKGNEVGFYACGPTVYHFAHLGNLRAYVFVDLLHRVLKYVGFKVNLVINITDVGHLTDDADQGEDKMEKGARREGKSVWDVAKYYTERFMEDIDRLNIQQPTTWCKATDHIEEQIDLVKKIEENGYAYVTEDGVYFDTAKLPTYGKLIPGFDASQLEAGKRVSMGEKRNPTDFALWKFSPKDEQRQMEWKSPWAEKGFPGWHIECTAMGCKYLGNQFDIHTGGVDHIPVHHTNEIAQAEGAFGHDHVRFWLHNEFLVLGEDERMGKSQGNFLQLQTVLDKGYDALDYRYFCMLTHHRKQLQFSWEAMDAARTARKRLQEKVIELKETTTPGGDLSEKRLAFQKRFAQAISDDLNIPEAVGIMHELLKSDVSNEEKLSLLLDWDAIFGLKFASVSRDVVVVPEDIQKLVDKREEYRKAKDFSSSDRVRDELKELGWIVSDTPNGPKVVPNK